MSSSRTDKIFEEHYRILSCRIDKMFAILLLVQWGIAVIFALWVSPRTWSGDYSQTNPHVYAAGFLGAALALYPLFLVVSKPGRSLNQYVIAIAQMLFSVLFIHLTQGRIETHFHIFGSLAFLGAYRNWRVLVLATAITLADHIFRGMFWPQSVYGVLSSTPWRALEHGSWVLFEDVVLFYKVQTGMSELRAISEIQAGLEETLSSVELRVAERTRDLEASNGIVMEQQQALVASAKLSALGEMAGGIAHEINNPLAIIKTWAAQLQELVQEKPMDEKMMVEATTVIDATVDRAAKIVSGLRAFSRDGSADPFTQVKLNKLIMDSVSFCRERFKNAGVALLIDQVRDIEFECRPVQISQVILNLLNNSYDATTQLSERWVKISAELREDRVEIRVTDAGNGIPESLRQKLFRPFFTTKGVGKGTGLGLSIARGIVASHGGTMSIASECPNTCFVLSMPTVQTRSKKQEAA